MKRLVFKKWVEVVNMIICTLGLVIIAAFEWNSIIPYIIGLVMLFGSSILEGMYGRNEEII